MTKPHGDSAFMRLALVAIEPGTMPNPHSFLLRSYTAKLTSRSLGVVANQGHKAVGNALNVSCLTPNASLAV